MYRQSRWKCFVHYGTDRPVPVVPGIYPSIEQRWAWRGVARSGGYIVPGNPFVRHVPLPERPEHLGSFVGCASSIALRHRISQLKDERLYLIDNTEPFIKAIRSGSEEQASTIKREYVEVSVQSKFVLCPRGFGTSSIRLFEAMEMGRTPVVLSDQWVPPDGPDWNSFLLRIRESDVRRIPSILRERESDAAMMGEHARRAWEDWFGPEVLFHRGCETCLDIMQISPYKRALLCAAARLNLACPLHLSLLYRKSKSFLRRVIEGSGTRRGGRPEV